jgi:hypothetical protein
MHALATPLDPFNFENPGGAVAQQGARQHYAAARASPVA